MYDASVDLWTDLLKATEHMVAVIRRECALTKADARRVSSVRPDWASPLLGQLHSCESKPNFPVINAVCASLQRQRTANRTLILAFDSHER